MNHFKVNQIIEKKKGLRMKIEEIKKPDSYKSGFFAWHRLELNQ